MMDKLKYYAQKCFEHIIANAVEYFLTTVMSFIVLNIPKFFSTLGKGNAQLSNISNVFSWLSVVLLCVSFVVLLINLKNDNKKTTKQNQSDKSSDSRKAEDKQEEEFPQEVPREHTLQNDTRDDLASEIHFRKVTISMKIESCTNIEYTMKYDGYATQDNIESFAKQLSWTGTKYIKTTLVSSNIEAHIEDNIGGRDHSPYTFKIVFDDDITQNERIKFTTKTVLSDQTKCMLPLSSFCVKYPIDELALTVSAPIGLLHTIRKKCYRDAGREIERFSSRRVEQQDIEGYRIYSFPQKNPTPWLYYVLEWKFSERYCFCI